MLKEFKEFTLRGNVVDMAVGIIIGAAFGKIVTSFVNDILMPPVGLLLGNVDFVVKGVPQGSSPLPGLPATSLANNAPVSFALASGAPGGPFWFKGSSGSGGPSATGGDGGSSCSGIESINAPGLSIPG